MESSILRSKRSLRTGAEPLVTVAMITYNHQAFIREAVQSILGQTYGNFELVIVDDGSTDLTREEIQGLSDPRIVYIRQDNMGPSEARNTALGMARGSLIAQMSGDDVAEPTRLERQLDMHRTRPGLVVFTRCRLIGDDGREVKGHPLENTFGSPITSRNATLRDLFYKGNFFVAPSAFAARAAFEEAGLYKGYLLQIQDYDMWIRLLLRGYEPAVVEAPLMRYRIRSRDANISAETPASRVRCELEIPWVLREYVSLGTAARLMEIFPEVADLGYPVEDDLVPFLIAMAAHHARPGSFRLRYFAAQMLLELMSDPGQRKLLQERAGFGPPDLFRILGEGDPFGAEGHRRELERCRSRAAACQRELQDLYASRTWGMARRLRDLVRRLSRGGRGA